MEDNDDHEFVSAEHDRLVKAISKLDKTQHIVVPRRSEPTHLNSEFNVLKNSTKLPKNLVKVLGDTAHHVQVSKKLKKSQGQSNVLRKPLEKPQAERIKRSIGYADIKEKIGRWDPIVARSRTVDFVSFPLKNVSTKLQPTEEFLSKFELKSSLEKELEEVDPQPKEETDNEEESKFVSYHEMLEQRMKIAKLRAQESYRAAKAKRQGKIKSKKYHRLLKKEKLQKQIKEFEELQQTNPEEALIKLEAFEKARALERHTLRHKNTGKWAKSKLIRAKFDKDVREQLAQQLEVSRALTKKTINNESTEDDDDNDTEDDKQENVSLPQNTYNNWFMRKKSILNKEEDSDDDFTDNNTENEKGTHENVNIHNSNGILNVINNKDYSVENNSIKINIDTGTDKQEDNDDEFTNKKNKNVTENYKINLNEKLNSVIDKAYSVEDNINVESNRVPVARRLTKKVPKVKSKKIVATTKWSVEVTNTLGHPLTKTVMKPNFTKSEQMKAGDLLLSLFDSQEKKITGEIKRRITKLKNSVKRLEKKTKSSRNINRGEKEKDNLEYLKLKNQKQKPIIDEELRETTKKSIEDSIDNIDIPISKSKLLTTNETSTDINVIGASNKELNKTVKNEPKQLHSALPTNDNDIDILDEDDQVVPKATIHDVLENDDIEDNFKLEKENEINKDLPKDIDSTLPGWGNWAGKGVRAPKRKRNRFIVKAPPKMPRRDENKGDVIIKEFKNPKVNVHKVADIPFPFSSVKEFEASIRAPLGNTFIPEKAHKKLIKPAVITKIGTIIEPMDEEELLKPKDTTYKFKKFFEQ